MTSWISFSENSLGLRVVDGYAEVDEDNVERIPQGSYNTADVPLPSPLSSLFPNWNEAIQSGLTSFYYVSQQEIEFFLLPIESYYFPVSAWEPEPLLTITVDFGGGEFRYLEQSDVNTLFFQLAYPTKLVNPPLSWEDLTNRGKQIIALDLAPYANSSVITGDPVDSSVVFVQNVCVNPESQYDSPMEALPDFQRGAAGIALSLGQPWPPALP